MGGRRQFINMPDCTHPQTELRLRTLSNMTTAVQKQCIVCGDAAASAVKKTSITPEELLALPKWDTELRDHYQEMERRQRQEESARVEAQWIAESPERKAAYAAYLLTPEWRAKRKAVMERDNHWCRGCHNARATQVHHLTYEHRGDELMWELVAVCDDCHVKAHQGRSI